MTAKKTVGVLLLWLVAFNHVWAQKNDYIWLSGYDSANPADTAFVDTSGYNYGISVMNFNYSPVHLKYDSLAMNFDCTNTSYCDNEGNLLFYTNGIYIANNANAMIANSNNMNLGWLDEVWDPSIKLDGYRSYQGILALQDLNNSSGYYLLHSFVDSGGDHGLWVDKLLSTYLDMSANNGQGNVIYNNRPVLGGNLGEPVIATRHGNGKYWWIITQQHNSNCYFSTLLNDTGFAVFPELSCGGNSVGDTDLGSAAFSPDGSKYACFAVIGGVNIFDFDRCTGQLSNPVFYPLDIGDSVWLGNGVAFSPNSRFLYISATKYLLQFDMLATDIAASVDTVGIYDGFRHPDGSFFSTAQLAPDGKIYISCGNAEADYHVINNPDAKGDSCNFQPHGLLLPSLSGGVPNFPNYRLGKLPGSPCDTITGLNEQARAAMEQVIKIYPNPATTYAIIDYGFTDWSMGANVSMEITDAIGKIVYTQPLPAYSGCQKLDVSSFAAGLYNVAIKRSGAVVGVAKLVKE